MNFDIGYQSDGGYRTEFKIPDDGPEGANYVLLLYAGRPGFTDGNSVTYTGVNLVEQH